MSTIKLEESQWQRYFDRLAKRIPTMRVGVSVLGDELGAQPEAEGAALVGISYDPKDGALTIDMANASHRIVDPSEIYVREQAGTVSSIEVCASDGTKQIIELSPLPSLPAS